MGVPHVDNTFGLAAENGVGHKGIARFHRVFTVEPELLNIRVKVNAGNQPLNRIPFLPKNQTGKYSATQIFCQCYNQIADRLHIVPGFRDRL
nr:hypothetical protein [Ruegeria denitrificans]